MIKFLCVVWLICGVGLESTQANKPFLNVSLVAVGFIAPIGISSLPYSGPVISAAINDVNAKYAASLRFQLKFLYDHERTTCPDLRDIAGAMVSEWHYRQRKESDLTVYMSTACMGEIPYFQSQWNTLWLTTMAVTMQIRNRMANPTWIGFNLYSTLQCADLYVELFNTCNWTTVVIIVDMSPAAPPIYAEQAANAIAILTEQRHITLIIRRITTTRGVPFSGFGPILEDIRRSARDYCSINGYGQRGLCTLHWQYGDENDQVAFQAFQSLLVVQYRDLDPPPNAKLGPELIRRSRQDYNLTYSLAEQFFPGLITSYLAILAVGEVLNESMAAGTMPDYHDGTSIARLFLNRTFTYEYGTMYVDRGGEFRRTDFVVTYFDSFGSRTPFLTKFGSDTSLVQVSQLTGWGNSTKPFPPPNVPLCGYLNDRPPCVQQADTRWTTGITGTLLCILIGTIVFGSLYMRSLRLKHNERMLFDPWWQIGTQDLQAQSFWRSSVLVCCKAKNEETAHAFEAEDTVKLALYQKTPVICLVVARGRTITFADLTADRGLLLFLKMYRKVEHDSVCRFYGLSIDTGSESVCRISAVFEHPSRGTLPQLWKHQISKEFTFTSSLIVDYISGLEFIHNSPFKHHGRLSIFNCWVDKHCTLKVMQLGVDRIGSKIPACNQNMESGSSGSCGLAVWESLFWLAPETAGNNDPYSVTSAPAVDIFSSGFILYDILTRGGLPKNMEFVMGSGSETITDSNPLKDAMDLTDIQEFAGILLLCISEDPSPRPTIGQLRLKLMEISSIFGSERNQQKLVDKILSRICAYSEQLERDVTVRTEALQEETKRCDTIIRQFLPKEIVKPLRSGLFVAPEFFDSVTVMFTDPPGFIDFTENHHPEQTLQLVAKVEDLFDALSTACDVYKVEAIGDSFVAASGLPTRIGTDHVERIAVFALRLMEVEPASDLHEGLRFKIGFHSGPCAAGVMGAKRPRYCLFGNTINLAARMCSHGAPSRIHLSADAQHLLQEFDAHNFSLEERGLIAIKGKGDMVTYWLNRTSDIES